MTRERIVVLALILSLARAMVADAQDMNGHSPHILPMQSEEAMPSDLTWQQVRTEQAAGRLRAMIGRDTKAFEPATGTWIDLPRGLLLESLADRCTGWMHAFVETSSGTRATLYVREWDIQYVDSATGDRLTLGSTEICERRSLTRGDIVTAQREGLVQAITNKVVTVHAESGGQVTVGPRFLKRDEFTIEWMSRSTSGLLRIPANRQVILEDDACRPVGLVKITYAGGTYWIRGLDLDIKMAGESLAKTPLGSGAWVLCD